MVTFGLSIEMPLNVRVSGVWTPVVNVWVNRAGTWEIVNRVSTRVAGVWTKVFGGDVVVTDPTNVSSFSSTVFCTSGFRFQTDGGLDEIGPAIGNITAINAGEWWDREPQALVGSDFRVRCVSLNSGSWFVQAAGVGAWVRMDVQRDWRVIVTAMASPDVESVSAEFEIAGWPDGAVEATFTLTAEASN